jgi:hypothetical protein
MSPDTARVINRSHWRPITAAAILLGGFAYLSFWAGIPQRGLIAWALGLLVLGALTLACGAAVWRWVLPATHDRASTGASTSRAERRLYASLLAISTLSLVVGGFWDEVWHRQYGLPFGEDLLWRPHLLIYLGLLLPVGLAAVALTRVLRAGQGSASARLRDDRALGLLVVIGGFLLFAVPADPIWHIVYGEDISAWSLPHLVLLLAACAIAILGTYLQLSSAPSGGKWVSLRSAKPASLMVLVFMAGAASLIAQVLIGDFAAGNPGVANRPVWLLPALMMGIALFVGSVANHSGRWYGAATAVGVLTLAIRFALVQAFDFHAIELSDWLPFLPPMVVLDLWYGFRALRGLPPARPAATATISLVAAAACLWLIPVTYPFLRFAASDLILTLSMCWLVSVAAVWLGREVGDGVAPSHDDTAHDDLVSGRLQALAPAALAAWVLFVVYFIATAGPPTHTF